jgi:hypothetical protein
MRRVAASLIVSLALCSGAFAVIITLFTDTDTFLRRAKDIVVAECIAVPAPEAGWVDLRAVEVDILKVLKGGRKPGRLRIATNHSMKPHTTYLLCSAVGWALETDFLAIDELSVVPLPPTFQVNELTDKDLQEQVQYIFSRRLFDVERELAPLLKEKELLEKAVADRRYGWYESQGPVKISRITEVSTQTDGHSTVWLDLEGRKLGWSVRSQGEAGYFYFEGIGTSRWPYWEFASCDATRIENLVDRPPELWRSPGRFS